MAARAGSSLGLGAMAATRGLASLSLTANSGWTRPVVSPCGHAPASVARGRAGSGASRRLGALASGVLAGAVSASVSHRRGTHAASCAETTAAAAADSGDVAVAVTGLPAGPFPVGVTTVQLDDHSRTDPEGGPRCLQTEIWYPAEEEARLLPPNRYSDFLGDARPEFVERAEDPDAIGGYRKGLTIAELDGTWKNLARRDARARSPTGEPYPVVLFSHGSGAFRASYVYFTEFLASQGFVVVACDHVGSSRYTILNGKVVKGGGARLDASQEDRPRDLIFLLDSLERMNLGADSRFAGRLDTSNCAVTGMSFGGWTTAKVVDLGDPRIKAAVMHCPSLVRGDLHRDAETPVMMMLGTEDTVIGAEGNTLCRQYFAKARGPRYLLQLQKSGHVTFTSCEQYNAEYGNGIGTSRSLSAPGQTYEPLPPELSHAIVNTYSLAFLDVHLRGDSGRKPFLESNHFGESVLYDFAP